MVVLPKHRGYWLCVLALVLVLSGCTAAEYDDPSVQARERDTSEASSPSSPTSKIADDQDASLIYDSTVADMIAAVQQDAIYQELSGLTGTSSITVGGQAFTLTTRSSDYPAYLNAATQYAYEYMQSQSLEVSYQPWSDVDYELEGRNVVAEIPGTTRADEIVLITAHLDDLPASVQAPGADDNASGSVGVMQAAARLAGHTFERTVRFVLFTGEEDDLLGSWAYAESCKARKENIVAVLNLDMIGWDGNDDGMALLRTRRKTSSGYAEDRAIALLLEQVVAEYGLSCLSPQILADQMEDSDQASFWYQDYPAITAIEDDSIEEENPNYHRKTDTLETLNLPYLTCYIKAAVGTAAHLAIPVSR